MWNRSSRQFISAILTGSILASSALSFRSVFRENAAAITEAADTFSASSNFAALGQQASTVSNDVAFGLNTTTFDTLVGTVSVNLPDDLAAGDTISGTVVAEAKKRNVPADQVSTDQAKNMDEISGYVVEVVQQETPVKKLDDKLAGLCTDPSDKARANLIDVCQTWTIPEYVSKIPVVLKNSSGKIMGRADIPVNPKANSVSEQILKNSLYSLPELGQSGRPIPIKGQFDGDFRSTSVKIQNATAKFLASSPRKVVVQSPATIKGPSDIVIGYKGKEVAKCTYRSVSIRLAADKLALTKGEQTTLTVTLVGLTYLLNPVPIRLTNKSPEIVSIAGGETQTFNVDPADVNEDVFITKRALTGIQAGGFSISAVVDPLKMVPVICGPPMPDNTPIIPSPQATPGSPRPQPTPMPGSTPSQSCNLYGETAGTTTGCCTSDGSITSIQSRFCEGISPDLPAPGSGAPRANDRLGSETTIAFVPAWTDPAGPHGARLVMGYNGSTLLTWTTSQDQGRTWSSPDKNANNGGPAGGMVPYPALLFNSYRGDLSLATAGPSRPGMVAMAVLADSQALPYPDLVVLLVSLDGGETFTRTSVVNDLVGIGLTDQPRVTFDPGDGTIWVLWRGRSSGLAGAAPYFTYVRGGHLDVNGTVRWDINGAGQQVQSNPIFPTIDYQHPRFKVFTRPGASSHTVAISGPQAAPGISLFGSNRCLPGTSGAIRNSFWQYPLGVFFAVSEDDGRHWTDLNSAVDMGQPFGLGCVGGVGGRDAIGQLIYAENRIDLARDPRNGTYLVTRARARSDSTSAFVGQQVEVWLRSTTSAARFTLMTSAPWSSANPWQFNPSIAGRDDGQIAVSYYQTTGTGQTVELMVMGSRDGGTTWSAPVQLSRNAPQTAADRSLGEYDEIVALPLNVAAPRIPGLPPGSPFWPGAFYASWSNGSGRVFAAGYSPPAR